MPKHIDHVNTFDIFLLPPILINAIYLQVIKDNV